MFLNIKYNTSTVSCTINSKWYLSIQAHKIQGSDRIFDFFPRDSLILPQKKHMNFPDLHEKSWSFSMSQILSFGFQLQSEWQYKCMQ